MRQPARVNAAVLMPLIILMASSSAQADIHKDDDFQTADSMKARETERITLLKAACQLSTGASTTYSSKSGHFAQGGVTNDRIDPLTLKLDFVYHQADPVFKTDISYEDLYLTSTGSPDQTVLTSGIGVPYIFIDQHDLRMGTDVLNVTLNRTSENLWRGTITTFDMNKATVSVVVHPVACQMAHPYSGPGDLVAAHNRLRAERNMKPLY